MDNSIFTNNTAVSGGAIYNAPYCSLNVTGSIFTGNTADYNGGAVNNDGNLTIIGSTFTGNRAVYGGAIADHTNLTIHFSRIVGNTATTGSAIYTTDTADARYNWWGSNANPSSKVSGNVTVGPWIVLTVKATPKDILAGGKSTVTADLLHDSKGVYHDPKNGHVPNGLPVTFTATNGTISPSQSIMVNGGRTSTFTAKNLGNATVKATVDNQTVSTNISVYPNLAFIASANGGTHYYGDTIHYYITVKNNGPTSVAGISVYDKLPSGLKFVSATATRGSYKSNTWTIGTLKPGQTAKLDIKATVNQIGTVTNKATLTESTWKTPMGIITISFNVPKAVPLSELIKASSQIKKYYEKNKKLPANLKVAGQTLTMPQLLKLLTTATLNISKKNLKPINVTTVGKAPKPQGYYRSGGVSNYLTVAQNIKTFINKNKRAPNYAATRLGNIPFSKLVYMYAKVINYYGQNKKLPNYVAI